MTGEQQPHPLRANFPQLSDSEFDRVLKTDEIVVALEPYLVQRGTDIELAKGKECLYKRNPTFPFPIGPTALEIAEIALNSLGSFAKTLGVDNAIGEQAESLATESSADCPDF